MSLERGVLISGVSLERVPLYFIYVLMCFIGDDVISPVAMAHVCRSSQRLPQHLVEEDAGKLRFNPRRQQPPSPSQRRGPGLIPVPNFKNRRLTSFSMSPQVLATTQNFNGYSIGSLVVFGYSFLLASFVLFLVNEKETKV